MPDITSPLGVARLLKQFVGLSALRVIAEFELRNVGAVLLRQVRKELNKKGSGRFYPSRRGSGLHQASAPGEPPTKDTGKLRRSAHIEIKTGVVVAGVPSSIVRIIVDGPAAATLEFGSRSRTLKPRPYMRPALAKAKKTMKLAMRTGLKVSKLTIG